MALVQLILKLRKKVAINAPDNDRAHAYLVSAAMHLVYPQGIAGPMRIIGPGDLMRRYDDGFTEVAKVQAILDGVDFTDPTPFGSDFDTQQRKLFDKIIAVSKDVAQACPEDDDAHRLLIEASMKMVFPNNLGGAYRIVGPGDILVRYRDGMVDAEKAEAIARVRKQAT